MLKLPHSILRPYGSTVSCTLHRRESKEMLGKINGVEPRRGQLLSARFKRQTSPIQGRNWHAVGNFCNPPHDLP